MEVVFGDSATSSQPSAEPVDLAWDLDVDAFLDDYLKEVGTEGQDPFGNFAIDVNVLGAFPPPAAADCTTEPPGQLQPEAATTLTSEFGAATLVTAAPSQEAGTKPTRGGTGQRKAARAQAGSNKGEPLDAKSVRKQLALQEKNRRAQRRFRERQKQKVEELTAQVEALTTQLGSVLAEKSSLENRAGALENALAMRNRQLEASGRGEVGDAKPSPVATAVSGRSSDAASTQGEEELAVAFCEDLTLSVREGAPTTLTANEVKGMTPAELAKYYKAYVHELAGCLVETSGQPASPERIRRLVDEVCLLCTRVALCNPPGVKHFTLTKVSDDPANAQAQHADDRVPQIVRALGISPQQRTQLSQLRRLFLQKLAKIVNDRKDINGQLLGAVPSGTSHRQMAVRYLAAHDATRKLRDNMREEHILVLDFVSTIFKHVLAAPQVAQFMIESFPYTPDCLSLSTWVAAEDGDAEALGLLAAEAQGKQQAAAGAAAGPGGALPSSAPPPAAVFALPPEQTAAMFAGGAGMPPAMFAAPGQMPLLPNGPAIIGNVAVSAAQMMQFGSGPLMMSVPSASFSTGANMVNNLNGMLKPGMAVPQLAMAKAGCFPSDLAGMLPVSPHVVTMTSSSR